MGQGGEEQNRVTPKIAPFSVSVLAAVANKTETAISVLLWTVEMTRIGADAVGQLTEHVVVCASLVPD